MSNERRDAWVDALVVVIATSLAFARSLSASLVGSWDDKRFLVDFEPVQSISAANFHAMVSGPHFEAYHPLHLLSYWIDIPLFGLNPLAIHATSLVLWCGALLLVLKMMRGLGLGRVGALVATLAFGLHPVQVEAVAWATGRKEIVALAFAACSILAHLKSDTSLDRYAWLSRGAYLLAALAKTTALPLPAVLFLIDVCLRERAWRDAVLKQVPALVLGAGLGALVISIWSDNEMIRQAPPGAISRLALVGATLVHDLETVLAPLRTSPIYPLHRTSASLSPAYLGMFALWTVMAYLARRKKTALFVLLACTALLLPVLNFVPLYFEVQDRYLSLPLLPLAFGLGAWVHHGLDQPEPSRRALLLASLAIVLFTGRTVLYQGAWQNDAALWQHATQTHPDAYYAWIKLAEVRRDEGDFDASIAAYSSAIDTQPTIRLAHTSRLHSMVLRDESQHDLQPSRAMAYAAQYHRFADNPEQLRELASVMVGQGYRSSALIPLGRSLDLSPLGDDVLERAAIRRVESEPWLARFYAGRMSRPPMEPTLIRFMNPIRVPQPPEVPESLRPSPE